MSACVIWSGVLDGDGYGRTRDSKRAHRVAYEAANGPIPEGLVIDHLCRNRACVNPSHLEVVTRRENTMRGIGISARNALKTMCSKGHPFDEANTAFRTHRDRQGKRVLFRQCLACNLEAVRAYKMRRQS